MKKVLIITYYWPPSGGAGVQRWLRHVKHLREFGWEPVIYTADNPNYGILDEKLEQEIPNGIETYKLKIKEPNNWISLFSKKKDGVFKAQMQKGKKRSLMQKLLWFVRGNMFIPDARVLWIKPSVKFLSTILEENKIDLIVSTGPPHSMHLIAKKLKDKFSIPWVADFRDPWTSMDYMSEMFITKYARKKHARLEESVIRGADKVVVVGRTMLNEFDANYSVKSEIIYNGYNESDEAIDEYPLDSKFTIVHIGSFLKNRNCDDLWKTLKEMTDEDPIFSKNLEIKLIGNLAPNVVDSIEKFKLKKFLNKIDYVPYVETQAHLFGAQVLLLPIDRIPNAEFVLTGKLFEYLKSKRPILVLGPIKGDAVDIIQQCKAGYPCDFDDVDEIRKSLQTMHGLYLNKNNNVDSVNVENFSGHELTKKLGQIFDGILNETNL
ncbi:MAG: glycosyltransferase [Crocinitomicaceae bacterium]|nr:glycosyltransferase [Crocinitomicaceae bacterium]